MAEEPESKGFLRSLFRSKTGLARRESKLSKSQEPPRRSSASEIPYRERRGPQRANDAAGRTKRPPRRSETLPDKGKGHYAGDDDGHPLTEWPPSGYSSQEELGLSDAMKLICRGVPVHRGHKRSIPHASEEYYTLYTVTAGNVGDETDRASKHDTMTQLMTMRTQGPGHAENPWDTLEQPSYSFRYGRRTGTVTLTQWASYFGSIPPPMALRDSGADVKEVSLTEVLERLQELEGGLEEDDENYMYKNLYKRFLNDPDKGTSPHKTLDKQIIDLISALSRPTWIDFTLPKNQVVTKFIYDTSQASSGQYLKFFHQLMLSMELDLRIRSKYHMEDVKEKLLAQLPPTIQWNLALSRRWRENVRIDEVGKTAEQIKLRLKLKRRQIKMIKRFAQMMKWPNLAKTLSVLRAKDEDVGLDSISSHSMAFFSGLVLPGPSFPFIMMNTLIDIDPDDATDDLALLTHIHPNCGFQYKNSHTYWSSTSIVGKVLAPTCHELAGWIGPARPTGDLSRSQIARVRCRRPRQRMSADDVETMRERSEPLGPPTKVFPVKEYTLVGPGDEEDVLDIVRMEQFNLRQCADRAGEPGPRWFDASIQFAIDGVSWPLRLTYDVSFISAWPCSDGPHPLFFDYEYTAVKAEEIVEIRDWAGLYGPKGGVKKESSGVGGGVNGYRSGTITPANGAGSSSANIHPGGPQDAENTERVLVVEAFGVPDNEVLARAWCAHWGTSAVIAAIGKTCMACAIREAYAATLNVVILVDGDGYRDA